MIKLIYKEKGISSFKTINEFAREHKIKKIGHTGTLDPLATGLLLIATDEDTKLIDYMDKKTKAYKATMILGSISDTYDIEGKLEFFSNDKKTLEEVEKAIKHFIGKYDQKPPIFSAKKINGKRAYEIARNNENVELKPVEVEIFDIKILNFDFEKQECTFEVEVSRGTYIRSLIHDIGIYLKTGAYMSELQRHRIDNLTLDDLNKELNPPDLIHLSKLEINDGILTRLLKGLEHNYLESKLNDGEYCLIFKNEIIGIAFAKNNIIKSKKLFGNKISKLEVKNER